MSAVAVMNSSRRSARPSHWPVHHAWSSRVPSALCPVSGAPVRADSSRPCEQVVHPPVEAEPDRGVRGVAQTARGLPGTCRVRALHRQLRHQLPRLGVGPAHGESHMVGQDRRTHGLVPAVVRGGHGLDQPRLVDVEGDSRVVREDQYRHGACGQGGADVAQFGGGDLQHPPALGEPAHLVARHQPRVESQLSAYGRWQGRVLHDLREHLHGDDATSRAFVAAARSHSSAVTVETTTDDAPQATAAIAPGSKMNINTSEATSSSTSPAPTPPSSTPRARGPGRTARARHPRDRLHPPLR